MEKCAGHDTSIHVGFVYVEFPTTEAFQDKRYHRKTLVDSLTATSSLLGSNPEQLKWVLHLVRIQALARLLQFTPV